MNRLFGAGLALTAALLLAACGKAQQAEPLADPPVITSFTASASRIAAGQSVTLSFTAERADSVDLVDDTGTPVDLSGDATAGEATVQLDATRFFVLRAKGEGGRDSAFVQVAVDADLREVFLVSVPPQIESGQTAQLVWSAFGAKGAEIRTSNGDTLALPAGTDNGVLEVTPERSVTYTLAAHGADTAQELAATAELKVLPVATSFEIIPAAAKAGETLTLRWKTRGAAEVVLSEATFGELTRASFPAEAAAVNDGSFGWTVPSHRPSGEPVTDGFPLRFELSVKQTNPQATLTRAIDSYVGDGPRIVEFLAPAAVTENKPLTVSWRTQNAVRLQVLLAGGVVYEPLETDVAAIQNGRFTMPAPVADADVTLRVWSSRGGMAQQLRPVRVVGPPDIVSFDLPSAVNAVGDAANAVWKTKDATNVLLRVKHGPAVYRTAVLTQVQDGSAPVYPGLQTTFVLEAYNDAGDVTTAERTVDVAVPATLTVGPTPAVRGSEVTVQWDISSAPLAAVVGPSRAPPVKSNPATDFYDLSNHTGAIPQNYDDTDDGLARLPVHPSFSFTMAGATHADFYVSTNGFIAFSDIGPRPDNHPLDDPGATPGMLAPFWDDLDLAGGRVLWMLEGNTFPRRLIVQWEDVQLKSDPTSRLSFQVQLFESGEVRYGYKRLEGEGTGGETASIGWRVNASLNLELATGEPVLLQDDELIWFTSASTTGTLTYQPTRGGVFNLFGRTQGGAWVVFGGRLNVIPAGAVLVNEVMVAPGGAFPQGQWVELFNFSDDTVDLSGTRLVSTLTGTAWLIPEGTTIPSRGYLVAGQSLDPNENGDAPVDIVWTDLVLDSAQADTLVLEANAPISQFGWLDVQPTLSLQAPEKAVDASGAPISCDRTATYNTAGNVGTPGEGNEVCFEYAVVNIAGAYEDISLDSIELMGTATNGTWYQHNLVVPFPYFGQPYNEISISSHGFITAGYTITANHSTNATAPGSGVPDGVIAPFWDFLYRHNAAATGDGALRVGRRADYTVVSWDNFRVSGAGNGNRMYFQVKLFDNGIIEFHYGQMDPSTSTGTTYVDVHTGKTATIWLERPNGSGALPIGINQPGAVQANTGIRFVPQSN